jgi:hypothetical protein
MGYQGTAFAIVLAVATAAEAVAGQLVVVESTTPKLQAGQVIQADTRLELASGSRVSLVGEDGKVTKLQGPYTGPAVMGGSGPGDPSVVGALSRLFATKEPSAQTWGTFRGVETLRGDEAAHPPEVWAINVLRSESVCLPAGAEPMLWRPEASRDLSVIVLHLSTGREATATFGAGEAQVAWPADVALLDGGEYALRDADNRWERRLFIRLIPADRAAPVESAAWMSDMGCIRQAKAMLASLTADPGSPTTLAR